MTEPITFARMRALIAEACTLDPARIEEDGRLRSYGLDSVRAIELAVMIEDAFGVKVRMDALDALKRATVRDLIAFVEAQR